ncbi:MAG: bifunctional aldolase/short-chain dehydrogenase [Rhodospirillaceae bacterium]
MLDRWSDSDAARLTEQFARQEIPEDIALRVYSARLLGREPRLVLHGGGNVSIKTMTTDLLGDPTEILHIKGSGCDMAMIEPAGLPAVRLAPLRRMRALTSLSDMAMVNLTRTNLLDAGSPAPSVEILLHAFLPHKFVDHTHSEAVLALSARPDGDALCRETFGPRAALVPYVMSGLPLARRAAEIYEANPEVEGLILLKHGILTFGATAREAYERMVALVGLAENRLAHNRKAFIPAKMPATLPALADIAPILRGVLAEERGDGDWRRPILDFRTSPEITAYIGGAELERYGTAGVVPPDHVIRAKPWPMIVHAPNENPEAFKAAARTAMAAFTERYRAYFARHNTPDAPKTALDPVPGVILVPGLGLFGIGPCSHSAAIAADFAESAVRTVTDAEATGRYEPVSEADLFEMEYWSLEQAKLGSKTAKPLAGQVVLITGGAGTIGTATGAAFLAEGAEIVLVDLDQAAAETAAATLGPRTLGLQADVTRPEQIRAVFDRACARFGGVDIVVSNAGIALQGRIGDLPDEVLRRSFEINFFAHQTVSQNAVRVMRLQGTGGALLYNVSKQAVNPGPDFGAYGLPKAATLFLVRQYALDHGRDGIRANAVNADRIRGGMLTAEMIAARSKARGLGERDYMAGNLLSREVTAEDVAQAFVHQALALKTTASVTTVDGGNIAAALR